MKEKTLHWSGNTAESFTVGMLSNSIMRAMVTGALENISYGRLEINPPGLPVNTVAVLYTQDLDRGQGSSCRI